MTRHAGDDLHVQSVGADQEGGGEDEEGACELHVEMKFAKA